MTSDAVPGILAAMRMHQEAVETWARAQAKRTPAERVITASRTANVAIELEVHNDDPA